MPVIRVDENGCVEFTRNTLLEKLAPVGDKSVVRMTDIEYEAALGGYSIKWLTGPYKGSLVNAHQVEKHVEPHEDLLLQTRADNVSAMYHGEEWVFVFATYEDAVRLEILIVEGMRREGIDLHG